MGTRVRAVTPLKAQMKRNFCQMAIRTSGWTSARFPRSAARYAAVLRAHSFPGQLSQYDLPRSGRLRYDPRRFDGRNDVGDRAESRVVSRYPGDALGVMHPVLQR